MNPKPRILLFTGDGKGKTTAALGSAIRALGHNLSVLIIQFIKGNDSSGDAVPCRLARQGRESGGKSVLAPPISSSATQGGGGQKTGDGRAAGNDGTTGEYNAFRQVPGAEIRVTGMGFVPPPSAPRFADHQKAARAALEGAAQALAAGKYRVIILDEICTAVALNLLTEEEVMGAVQRARGDAVVVLTGRGAGQGLIDLADTVTEMRCVKHAYQQGRKAQKGVEF